MNLNEKIRELKEITGFPTSQDLYEGSAEKYIVFTYQDERPIAWGDNAVLSDKCEIYISLYVPISFNYFSKKDQIRNYLEQTGFVINNISTGVETFESEKIRRITFDCSYTEERS